MISKKGRGSLLLRSLVCPIFPALRQADTQIPLIKWDAGRRHVNTEEDKQATVGILCLFYAAHCALGAIVPLGNLYQIGHGQRQRGHVGGRKHSLKLL